MSFNYNRLVTITHQSTSSIKATTRATTSSSHGRNTCRYSILYPPFTPPSMSHPPAGTATAPRKSIGLDAYSPVSNLDMYTTMSCIGKGSFGVIHKVARKCDGQVGVLYDTVEMTRLTRWHPSQIFALKELDYSKMPPKDRKQMLQEV